MLLAATTLGVLRLHNLFAVAMVLAVYSFLMATLFVVYDAVDVAMTEASVGAGISTVLVLATLQLTKTEETKPMSRSFAPLFVAGVTAVALLWGVGELPDFGVADSAIHVAGPDYVARSVAETGIPNVVTSVLASYRGFDTLGETAVIFTAGIAVLLLLKRSSRQG